MVTSSDNIDEIAVCGSMAVAYLAGPGESVAAAAVSVLSGKNTRLLGMEDSVAEVILVLLLSAMLLNVPPCAPARLGGGGGGGLAARTEVALIPAAVGLVAALVQEGTALNHDSRIA